MTSNNEENNQSKMAMVDDLWRQCAAWLTQCKVIPPDHKANLADSEIRVLALTLRDGVLLCNLLNFIDPGALDMKDFNRKPQMAQVCDCPFSTSYNSVYMFDQQFSSLLSMKKSLVFTSIWMNWMEILNSNIQQFDFVSILFVWLNWIWMTMRSTENETNWMKWKTKRQPDVHCHFCIWLVFPFVFSSFHLFYFFFIEFRNAF